MNMVRCVCLSLIAVALVAGCGKKEGTPVAGATDAEQGKEEKVLNLYIWNLYLAPDTVSNFEKETGIKVSVTNYGSNEELDAKLAPGNSGYDVVVPSASYYQRQIKSGYYRKLDKSKLSNYPNMDPKLAELMRMHDSGNEYAVLHTWGTSGIGYNVAKVKAALGNNAPVDSWKLVFDPANAKKLGKCGFVMLESAGEMFAMSMAATGRNPNSQDPADIEAGVANLMKIRPYVRYVRTDPIIADLASGEICVAIGYIGDFLQARDRAAENRTEQQIAYSVPKEGSVMWFDSYMIPKDAPHPDNAHAFINYLLRPEVAAGITNSVHYANGNAKATALVDEAIRNDPGVYPPEDVKAKLVPIMADTEETSRLKTRMWTRFMTGK